MSYTNLRNTYASFADPQNAERAGGALLDHGIRGEHISIVFPESYNSKYQDKFEEGHQAEKSAESGISTTTVKDAAIGSAKGAGIGLAAGALAALAAVFIPGIGLVLGGGALALAVGGVGGATVAGAVAGGVTGYLKDQGVPDDQVLTYQNALTAGGAMITVSPTDEAVETREIENVLTKYGGAVASFPLTGLPQAVINTDSNITDPVVEPTRFIGPDDATLMNHRQ